MIKYVNGNTVECLAILCSEMSPNAKVVFFVGKHASIDKLGIEKIFKKYRSDIKIELKVIKTAEKIEHDRYIFLGNRLQLWMSNGLDAVDCNKCLARSDIRITAFNVYKDYVNAKIIPQQGRAELVRVVD